MSKRNKIGPLCLSVVALSMGACSTSYDCSSSDVVDALVQEAATSGFVPHLNPAPAEWTTRLASHTKARNIVTLDEDEGTQHFRCRANLEYSEAARTVTSKDITYDVRKIEGEDDFSLEWEVPNDGIGDIDPIKLFAMDVQGPWKGELEKQQEADYHDRVASQNEEATTWARGYAADYAAKHPPIPFDRDALKKHADDFIGARNAELVMEQFHDIDGDGFQDYMAITASSEFDKGEFAEETENYGEYVNTGGFMRKTYFLVAVTQVFNGFGRATNMGLQEPIKVVTATGEKVTGRYLPNDIASVASAPENPIVGVTNADGDIVVSLASGQAVTIKDFKPEKTLAQMQQDRMRELEERLIHMRARGGDISSLYD